MYVHAYDDNDYDEMVVTDFMILLAGASFMSL